MSKPFFVVQIRRPVGALTPIDECLVTPQGVFWNMISLAAQESLDKKLFEPLGGRTGWSLDPKELPPKYLYANVGLYDDEDDSEEDDDDDDGRDDPDRDERYGDV